MRFFLLLSVLVVATVSAQEPVTKQAKKPPTIEERLSGRWIKEHTKSIPYSYPCFDWVNADVGDFGTVWPGMGTVSYVSGRDSIRFVYVKQLEKQTHLIRLDVDYLVRNQLAGEEIPTNPRSTHAVFKGQDFKNAQNEDVVNIRGQVVYLGDAEVPGFSQKIPAVKFTKFPPLPIHTAQLGIDVRTWSSRSGKFSREAAYDSFSDGEVSLVLTNGKKAKIPMADLSGKDQRFVRKKLIESKAKKVAKPVEGYGANDGK